MRSGVDPLLMARHAAASARQILVVSSDAGGTMALVPVVRELIRQGAFVRIVAAGPAEALWEQELPGAWSRLSDSVSQGAARRRLMEWQPVLLVTGAGAYNRIEHTFRRAAASIDLFCFSLVDAWFNFRPRFMRRAGERAVSSLPNLIGVMDEASYREMVDDGFEASRLVIVGAPHIEETVQRVRGARESQARQWREELGVPSTTTVLAFFSQPIVPQESDAAPSVGLGYTQTSVFRDLLHVLARTSASSGVSVVLLVKPHPSERAQEIARMLESCSAPPGVDWRIVDHYETAQLIRVADAVLGCTTTVLLEAAWCGKPVLSLQMGRNLDVYPDPYFGNRPGITPIYHEGDCCLALKQLLTNPPRRVGFTPPRQLSATAKVVEILWERLHRG